MVQLSNLVLISRLTSSHTFGVSALMIAISTGMLSLSQFNIDSYLTSNKYIGNMSKGSIWSFLICVNISLAIIINLVAFYLNWSLENRYILLGSGLILICWSIGSVPKAVLLSEGKFKKLAKVGVAGSIINLTFSLLLIVMLDNDQIAIALSQTMAVLGSSVFAIAMGRSGIYLRNPKHIPKSIVIDFFHTSTSLFANFLARNVDTFMIFLLFGASALGLYDRAYFLMLAVQQFLSQVLGRVVLSDLSYRSSDEFLSRYFQLNLVYQLSSFVLFVPFIFTPKMVIDVFLGGTFSESHSLVQIFGIVGIVQASVSLSGTFFQVKKELRIQSKVALITSSVYLINFMLFPILNLSLNSFAIANLCSSLISYPIVFYYVRKLSGQEFNSLHRRLFLDILKVLIPFLVAALLFIIIAIQNKWFVLILYTLLPGILFLTYKMKKFDLFHIS